MQAAKNDIFLTTPMVSRLLHVLVPVFHEKESKKSSGGKEKVLKVHFLYVVYMHPETCS